MNPVSQSNLLPVNSWIQDYFKAIDQVSEAPMHFSIWSAISVISSVLKRNVYFKYKNFTIYPNQFIVLVAGPGIGKGTSITPAHKFAKENGLVNYMSDRVTAPRIIEKLHMGFSSIPKLVNGQVVTGKDSTATLMSAELPTLLTSSDWMLQFLCDAWDRGEFDYDTKNNGSFTVKDMCVSLIGACVPDYIRKLNKDANATVSSGFSARTIFVYAKEKSKILSWGEGFDTHPLLKTRVADLETRLKAIANLAGEMHFDAHARLLWDTFYSDHHASYDPDDTDVYNNFRSRQPIHVIKVAMAISASETDKLIITHNMLKRAISLVENVSGGVDEIFKGVGESDVSSGLGRIESYIERKCHSNGSGPKTITYNEILKDNIRFVNHDHIVKIMQILESIGFVTHQEAGGVHVFSWTGKPAFKKNGVKP